MFRLRCYMASLQASELPNPKVNYEGNLGFSPCSAKIKLLFSHKKNTLKCYVCNSSLFSDNPRGGGGVRAYFFQSYTVVKIL